MAGEDQQQVKPSPSAQKKAAVAAAIAAAVTIIGGVTASFEGTRTKPYIDPAGVPTVCIGETAVPMRDYSADECRAMLKVRQEKDFGPLVVRAVPALAQPSHKWPLSASIDFAYNVGNFSRTSMARDFRTGNWQTGCAAFALYRFARDRRTHQLIVLAGLVTRRECEVAICDHTVKDIKTFCPPRTPT